MHKQSLCLRVLSRPSLRGCLRSQTFGNAEGSLPVLPIVAGYRQCTGTEASVFDCTEASPVAHANDMGCTNGCSVNCMHSIDQGAICFTNGQTTSNVKPSIPTCTGPQANGLGPGGALSQVQGCTGCGADGALDQAIVFGCIDFYSTACNFDASNANTHTNTYSRALRGFAACAEVIPEVLGYCHGALSSAAALSNQAVCVNGQTTNIGFHVRIPFSVVTAGTFTFRMHADYGLGSFIGVDGATNTPGNLYGHIVLPAAALSVGDHEFEALGFEDCCDAHQELELHLPCDTDASAYRLVTSGETDCLKCSVPVAAATCSSQESSAGDCANGVCVRSQAIGRRL